MIKCVTWGLIAQCLAFMPSEVVARSMAIVIDHQESTTQTPELQGLSAKEYIDRYESIEFPVFSIEAASADHAAYMLEYNDLMGAVIRSRADIAAAFFKEFPNHPRANEFISQRWNNLLTIQAWSPEIVLRETLAVLQNGGPKDLVSDAAYYRARATGMLASPRWEPTVTLPEIDRLARIAPRDNRAARLLMLVADNAFDVDRDRIPFWRRIIDQYSDSSQAELARGRILREESMGKSVAISFRDEITRELIDTSTFEGRIVIVDFWATWCGPCVEQMPMWRSFFERFNDRIVLIGVNGDLAPTAGGRGKLHQYLEENDIGWPQFYIAGSRQQQFADEWGVYLWPTVFIIGTDGKLRFVGVGADATPARIEKEVRKLLDEAEK